MESEAGSIHIPLAVLDPVCPSCCFASLYFYSHVNYIYRHMCIHTYMYTHTEHFLSHHSLFSSLSHMISGIPIPWLVEWFCSCLWGVDPVLQTGLYGPPWKSSSMVEHGILGCCLRCPDSHQPQPRLCLLPPLGLQWPHINLPISFFPAAPTVLDSLLFLQTSLLNSCLPHHSFFSPAHYLSPQDSSSSSSLIDQPMLWLLPFPPVPLKWLLSRWPAYF